MSVSVVEASADEAFILNNLGELYVHDFSEIVPSEVNASGRFDPDFLRDCWGRGNQTPYLIRVADRRFAIVGRGSRLTGDPVIHDLSEFFIVRRYRRQGIGTRAAAALSGLRRGTWEVRERAGNAAAHALEATNRFGAAEIISSLGFFRVSQALSRLGWYREGCVSRADAPAASRVGSLGRPFYLSQPLFQLG